MKPNNIQKKLVKSISSIISSWGTTNDINSPTHGGDITEELFKFYLDDELTENQVEEISNDLGDILNKIKKIKGKPTFSSE